jgi:TolB protein
MSWKKKERDNDLVPIPAEPLPAEGMGGQEEKRPGCRSRIWLWGLGAALSVVLVLVFAAVLGVLGVYDGLKDRAIANRQLAQEHYDLGMTHLAAGDYELAIAEFEEAMRHDSSLPDLQNRLREARDLARAQVTPTSETRKDAAALLYREAVPYYESGDLAQAVTVLEDLRGVDQDYQRENVEAMLVRAHYQLGVTAVQEDRLDDATEHFEAVLALDPNHEQAQDQLNLLSLYAAAMKHWEQDWSTAIQALKGLYALAPEYKDVRARLHNAHIYYAEELAASEDWCQASEQYAAAVEVFPLEATVDKRDDAAIWCRTQGTTVAATQVPRPTPTLRAGAEPTAGATTTPMATSTPVPSSLNFGTGRIAFSRFDRPRQAYDIHVVDLSRGDINLLRANASQPAFAPGGGRLAFRNHDPSHLGLGIVDLASGFIEMTAHAEDTAPAWSPDRAQIVFASNKHGDRKWRIYVISPGAVRGEGEEWVFGQMPSWSADGTRIVYHGCDQRGDQCGVWAMKAGGFDPARLTSHPSDTAPAWSPAGAPGGDQVAFTSARTGNWDLYAVDVASGQESRLTDHFGADVAPTWSPDGKRLAFLSNRDGAWAVYILDIGSGRVQKVIPTGDDYPDPVSARLSWAP